MTFTNLLGIHQEPSITLADNISVGSGGQQTSTTMVLSEQLNKSTVGYHINAGSGTPSVELQISIGQDVNGADVWVEVATSTSTQHAFYLEQPADKARLVFTETSGSLDVSLDGINAWAKSRAL